ncbi:hypothetical protein ACH5RR_036548 [Cinchona calisaya]|uniref:Uncharacterized protein n=1 Tax=Cinchona calisaya TaxID=153742 RepID=A0ABD2Y846_9GENT
MSGTSNEIMEFIDLIFWNLRDLLNWKPDHIVVVSVKKQIRIHKSGFTNQDSFREKIKPYTPDVVEKYVGVLIASKSSEYVKLLIGEIVVSLVDLLLEDLMPPMKNHIEILTEGLVFMITFLINPPDESETEAGKVLLTEIEGLIREVLAFVCSLYTDGNEEDISRRGKVVFLVSKKRLTLSAQRYIGAPKLQVRPSKFLKSEGIWEMMTLKYTFSTTRSPSIEKGAYV